MTLKELQEKRQALAAKIQELAKRGEAFNSEDQASWDEVNKDYDANAKLMEVAQRAADVEAEQRQIVDKRADELRGGSSHQEITDQLKSGEARDHIMLNAYTRQVCGRELTEEQRSVIEEVKVDKGELVLNFPKKRTTLMHVGTELRAQATTPGSAGGDLIAEGFMAELEKRLLFFGPMVNVARPWRTNKGNDIPWPTVDDTSNVGAILAENAAVTEQDVTFSSVTFNAFKYTSKLIKVSQELLEDSEFNIGDVLLDLLAERIGRITNTHLTTGDGSSKPRGAVTAAGTVAAAGAAAITGDDLIDLKGGLDIAYRPNALFQANDLTITAIRKLVDGQGQFIWQSGLQLGNPDILLGHRLLANNDMDTIATTKKTVLFGDFSKYLHRMVLGMRFLVLNELFRANDQVGFVAFLRQDGDSIQDNAFKVLLQA